MTSSHVAALCLSFPAGKPEVTIPSLPSFFFLALGHELSRTKSLTGLSACGALSMRGLYPMQGLSVLLPN